MVSVPAPLEFQYMARSAMIGFEPRAFVEKSVAPMSNEYRLCLEMRSRFRRMRNKRNAKV